MLHFGRSPLALASSSIVSGWAPVTETRVMRQHHLDTVPSELEVPTDQIGRTRELFHELPRFRRV